MSQGLGWPSYALTDHDAIDLFLTRSIRLGGKVSFEGLMRDTDMKSPPIYIWYKLHEISKTRSEVQAVEDLWSTMVIAWGLNIWESDLLKLCRTVIQELALRRRGWSNTWEEPLDVERTGTCTTIYSLIEDGLSNMPPRFADFPGEHFEWRLRALSQMTISCWRAFLRAKDRGFYDKTTGSLTESGIKNWSKLSDQAEYNDRAHGAPTCPARNKRKVDGDSELDQDGRYPKRNKTMHTTDSTNKRQMDLGDEDAYNEHPTAKRMKTTSATSSSGKRARDDHDEIEDEDRFSKRQAFGH